MYALLKEDGMDQRVERICATTDSALAAYARLLASMPQARPVRSIVVLHTVRHKGDLVDEREVTILYKDL